MSAEKVALGLSVLTIFSAVGEFIALRHTKDTKDKCEGCKKERQTRIVDGGIYLVMGLAGLFYLKKK